MEEFKPPEYPSVYWCSDGGRTGSREVRNRLGIHEKWEHQEVYRAEPGRKPARTGGC